MKWFSNGAQRASRRLFWGPSALILAAALLVLSGTAIAPQPAAAASGMKVVIVVGPTGSGTKHNIDNARQLAAQARGYGATVIEIYSPNATWARVRSAAQGAKVLIYMGHGNGWPSPYRPYSSKTKDGLGLNATAKHGNLNVKYYGEWYLRKYIHLAPNAVVLLGGLCYSAGNSEPGKAAPSVATAHQRIDNYAAGFLHAGARAVFAEPYGSVSYILTALFTSNSSMRDIFTTGAGGWGGWGGWGGSSSTMTASSFASAKTSFATVISDRDSSGRFRRSVVGVLDMTAATVRG